VAVVYFLKKCRARYIFDFLIKNGIFPGREEKLLAAHKITKAGIKVQRTVAWYFLESNY
jgi:hypothetical protein